MFFHQLIGKLIPLNYLTKMKSLELEEFYGEKNKFHDVGLTLQVVASNKLQHLINEDDRDGQLQHYQPLLHVQMGQLEDQLKNVEMRKMSIKSASLRVTVYSH